VSIYRKAAKIDNNQTAIVNALRAIGCRCWYIRTPFDLLCRYRGSWHVLEVKMPKKAYTPKQEADLMLLDAGAVKTVHSVEEALDAVRG